MEWLNGLYDHLILNYQFSLQNAHGWASDHMSFFHAMQWLIWKALVITSILQKEWSNLEFWIKSYAMLNFHVHFACLCGLWPIMYIIITKTLKNFCVDRWLDLGQMDLELRQHSYAKGLGQCQLLWNPLLAIWNFIWYIFEDPFDFICNIIIMKLLF